MMRRFATIVTLAAAVLLPSLGGASVAAQDAPADCASALWLAPLAATPSAGAERAATPAPANAEAPVWLTAELTDACSGETFTLADFAGKTLLIETMATWCGECFAQLTRLKEAAALMPDEQRADIVLVSLSLETDLPPAELAAYAAKNGFSFVFAVLPAEMVQDLAADFGQVVTVPPATPHVIVAPDGTIGELRTGPSSPEELLALFAEAAGDAAP